MGPRALEPPVLALGPRRSLLASISRWSVAAAVGIATCLIGYDAGVLSVGTADAATTDLIDEMTFGVFDALGGDAMDWDMLAAHGQEVSG